MTDGFLQHAIEAIAGKVLDEACAEQALHFRKLIGIHDAVAPRPIQIHEVDASAAFAAPI